MSRRGRGGKNRHHRNGGRPDQPGQQQKPGQRQQPQQNLRQGQSGEPTGVVQYERHAGKITFPSITQPRRNLNRPTTEQSVAPKPANRNYKLVFFDTLSQARADLANLRELATQCDQLNIVIRAEGPADDQDLLAVGKLFCGAAWALIHERRRQDGWYDAPHE